MADEAEAAVDVSEETAEEEPCGDVDLHPRPTSEGNLRVPREGCGEGETVRKATYDVTKPHPYPVSGDKPHVPNEGYAEEETVRKATYDVTKPHPYPVSGDNPHIPNEGYDEEETARKAPYDDTKSHPCPKSGDDPNVPSEGYTDEETARKAPYDDIKSHPCPKREDNPNVPSEEYAEEETARKATYDVTKPHPYPKSGDELRVPNQRRTDEETARKEPYDEANLNPSSAAKDLKEVGINITHLSGQATIAHKIVENTVITGCTQCQGRRTPGAPQDVTRSADGPAGCAEMEDAVSRGLWTLQQFGRTIVTGPPLSGKTAVAWALLDDLRAKGYSLHLWCQNCRQPPPLPDACSRGWVLLIDGAVGDVCLDVETYKKVELLLDNIYSNDDVRSQCLVVLTAYPHLLREIQHMDEGRNRQLAVSDVVVSLGQDSFSPDLDSSTARRVLTNYRKLMQRLVNNPSTGKTMAAVIALNILGVEKQPLEERDAVKSQLHQLGIDGVLFTDMQQRASYLQGNILSSGQHGFTNQALHDAAGLALGLSTVYLPVLLKVCSERFLVDRVRVVDLDELSSGTEEDTGNFVSISFTDRNFKFKLLMRRIYELVLDGKFYCLCQYPALTSQRFLDRFEQFCLDEDKGLEQLMASRHRESNLPLLFYTLWGPSDTLTSWCLKHTIRRCSDKALVTEAVLSAMLGSLLFADSPTAGMERVKQTLTAVRTLGFRPEPQSSHLELTLPLPPRDPNERRNCYDGRGLAQLVADVPASLLSVQVTNGSDIVKISAGNWYLALRLLTDQAADETDCDGNTLLHLAAEAGDEDAIHAVMKRNDSLTAVNAQGLTPYQLSQRRSCKERGAEREKLLHGAMDACRRGDVDRLKRLLALHGFSMQKAGEDGDTLLHCASREGQQAVVSLLLDLTDKVNITTEAGTTPLHVACRNGHQPVVSLLLDRGAEINTKTKNGFTPLHSACYKGNQSVVSLLLDQGAELSATTTMESSPLHLACQNGHQSVVSLFLDRGAELNTKRKDGSTALHLACYNGHQSVVSLVLDRGAELNTKEIDGWTPLHVACNNGHQSVVSLLLDRRADLSATTTMESSPLHLACYDGHQSVVSLLLDRGTEPNTKRKDGSTPLHVACYNGNQSVVFLLLDRGAKVNARDKDGFMPLHVACRNGHQSVVSLLLYWGAKVNARGKDGRTPLRCANQGGHLSVASLLRDRGAKLKG